MAEILVVLGSNGPKMGPFLGVLENDVMNFSKICSVVRSYYELSIDVGVTYPSGPKTP